MTETTCRATYERFMNNSRNGNVITDVSSVSSHERGATDRQRQQAVLILLFQRIQVQLLVHGFIIASVEPHLGASDWCSFLHVRAEQTHLVPRIQHLTLSRWPRTISRLLDYFIFSSGI